MGLATSAYRRRLGPAACPIAAIDEDRCDAIWAAPRDPDQISVDTNTSGDALQGQADTIRSFDESEKILLQGSHSFAGQGMAPAEANTPSGAIDRPLQPRTLREAR